MPQAGTAYSPWWAKPPHAASWQNAQPTASENVLRRSTSLNVRASASTRTPLHAHPAPATDVSRETPTRTRWRRTRPSPHALDMRAVSACSTLAQLAHALLRRIRSRGKDRAFVRLPKGALRKRVSRETSVAPTPCTRSRHSNAAGCRRGAPHGAQGLHSAPRLTHCAKQAMKSSSTTSWTPDSAASAAAKPAGRSRASSAQDPASLPRSTCSKDGRVHR